MLRVGRIALVALVAVMAPLSVLAQDPARDTTVTTTTTTTTDRSARDTTIISTTTTITTTTTTPRSERGETEQVRELVRPPAGSVVRVTLATGGRVYGCVVPAAAPSALSLRVLDQTSAAATNPCADTARQPQIDLLYRDLARVDLRQLHGQSSGAALVGALLGGLGAGAVYATMNKESRCRGCLLNTPLDWVGAGALVGAAGGALVGSGLPDRRWTTLGPAVGDQRRSLAGRLLDLAKVEATAGAGFAGIRVAEVLRTDVTDESYVPVANYRYEWGPALSTGLVTYVYPRSQSQLGIGLGFQIVALPISEGKTSPYPGVSMHFGTPDTEFFVGMVLSPTDSVAVPGGRVTAATETQQFILENARRARHLYAGIQVKGTRKDRGDIGIPEGSRIRFMSETVFDQDAIAVVAYVVDSLGRPVRRVDDFEVTSGNAAIRNGWLFPDAGADLIVVQGRAGNLREHVRITRRPPAQRTEPTSSPTRESTETPRFQSLIDPQIEFKAASYQDIFARLHNELEPVPDYYDYLAARYFAA